MRQQPLPGRPDRAGGPFWRDSNGFTSRDFKVVVTTGIFACATIWIAWLLMTGRATALHLEFYRQIAQVYMVLLGGMAAQQFGSMWMAGRYDGGYSNTYGGGYDGNSYGPGPAVDSTKEG